MSRKEDIMNFNMSEDLFYKTIALTSLRSEATIKALMLVFVDGKTHSEARTKYNIDKSLFSRRSKTFLSAFGRGCEFADSLELLESKEGRADDEEVMAK